MSSDLEKAVDELGPIIQSYQSAVDDFDREAARILRVNDTDLRCLEQLVVAGDAGATPREIADRLALTTGSVTTMLDRLEKAGYVTRSQHPTDGRRVIVHLTPQAHDRIWDIIGPHFAESSATVAAGFSAAELDTVKRFLATVTAVQQAHVTRLREGAAG
ncbi:MarR family winged helix-turn-helix transcriptional regulator [Leifsonia shinshuensis]|uniref:MarR family transcriptional regulator n=1 Tax=Leifsonia shinshuensis TaxID=150026 RepID=A0A7G6YCI0_9MICO|nr:MarR family transcriptional regulator [Leifsonia shinshuensis]QNE36195.1 MarR family transcriptional regulator [Leifsonia shinshuensis]